MTKTKATTLFTLDTLKAWIKTTGIDATDDARLVIAADGATAELEQAISLFFVKRSVTETLSGDGKCAFALKNAPIISIDSFTVDGLTVDPTTYILDPVTGIITSLSGGFSWMGYSGFSWGVKNIVVTYTAGFDIQDGPNLPSDVYRAGLDLTKAIYDELISNTIVAQTVSLGASTMVIKAAKYPPSVQRVIDNYAGVGMRA